MAKNSANMAPADEPEISFTFTKDDSRHFRDPMSEKIPIQAGPSTRYFILLLNRTEEIDGVRAQTPRQTPQRESQQLECWSVLT